MISAVSGISFGDAVNAQDLINSPGQFTTVAPQQEVPADSFEKTGEEKKKSHTGLKVAIGVAVAALAAFIGLGYAVHNHHLERVDIPAEGFFAKIGAHIKNAATEVGGWADSSYKWVKGLFGSKEAKAAADAAADAAK